MRVFVVILAVAATPLAAAILWMRAHPDPPRPPAVQLHSVVWADRVFTSRAELRRWLRARGERYAVWARKHPVQAAALEHRRPPKTRPAVRTAAPRPDGGGSFAHDAALLAALFALTGAGVVTFRARRRLHVSRPHVTLPAIRIDVRPVVQGLRRPRAPATAPDEVVAAPQTSNGSRGGATRGRPRVGPALAQRNGHDVLVDQPAPAFEPEATTAAVEVEATTVAVEPEATTIADVPPLEAEEEAVSFAALLPVDVVQDGKWELCTTACWRGYAAARFYAHPPGDAAVIVESSPFDWWAWQTAPRDPRAEQAAFEQLCGLLAAEGWEPFARGDTRHEIRFRRRPRVQW
jgi:hypothetical protein